MYAHITPFDDNITRLRAFFKLIFAIPYEENGKHCVSMAFLVSPLGGSNIGMKS